MIFFIKKESDSGIFIKAAILFGQLFIFKRIRKKGIKKKLRISANRLVLKTVKRTNLKGYKVFCKILELFDLIPVYKI
ncbi:hypothetical protein GCM10009865_06920 [Aeromicrobium ponti]|uniref:Uncharacterized protein n=1 Tax=Cytobacillus oceanisediminis TaxID=665099 RepID=A0A562K6S7_9BACI|nr:hypothetical protein IQ19_00592 [Cytobacillus oceanisediminis]